MVAPVNRGFHPTLVAEDETIRGIGTRCQVGQGSRLLLIDNENDNDILHSTWLVRKVSTISTIEEHMIEEKDVARVVFFKVRVSQSKAVLA